VTKVLITCPPALATADQYLQRLSPEGITVLLAEVVQQLSEEQLLDRIGDIDGLIAGDDQLTARVLEAALRLRVIVRWGIGMDNVDLQAAGRLGIRVVNTPGVFGDEVADVAIGYLILLARQLHRVHEGVRAGHWPKPQGMSLAGRRLTIVGLGSIGRAVARRALAMGMSISGCDVTPAARDAAAAEGIHVGQLDHLVEQCDALMLCSPLTPQTRQLVNARLLERMPAGGWLVNVARGGLVDEAALIDALRSGHLAGAALDVFETEPLPLESPLRDLGNVIFGSHNASNTVEAVRRVNELACERLLQGLIEVSR
jgi:D-3-phosphoglycerate dehydrogenase / 2-oxoglutarate reductase